jgi:hypothetical protein
VFGRVTMAGVPHEANVILLGTRLGAFAWEDGAFLLERAPVGNQVLQFASLGARTKQVPVVIRAVVTDTVAVDLEDDLPCFHAKSFTAPCFRLNGEELRRVGTRCRVHPWRALRADTVRIAYGYSITRNGFGKAHAERFPNANESWDGGCEVHYQSFTNVAYCPDCRRAYDRWWKTRARHDVRR